MSNQQIPSIQDDEITLKELILKIREYWQEIFKNKWLIILFTIPIVGGFLAYTMWKKPEYIATLRFIVEGESGASFGGLGGLLGQFGIRSGGGKSNPFQMVEVAKSPDILKDVLFQRIPEQDNEFIANIIIRDYELDQKWKKKYPELEGFRFNHAVVDSFGPNENRAFRSVMGKVLGPKKKPKEALNSISFNEDTGIFTINSKTESEDVSIALCEQTYETLKFFYEEKILANQKQTRDLLKTKVDSLNGLLEQKQIQLARFQDASMGLISREVGVKRDILSKDISALGLALGEAMKSFEIADYAYKDRKPVFLAIDRPLPPITPEENSKLMAIIKGLLLGFFLGTGYVLAKKIIRDAMNA
jgi:hypothetical protein